MRNVSTRMTPKHSDSMTSCGPHAETTMQNSITNQAVSSKRKQISWDPRRWWMAMNVYNHGIYAVIFIIRTLFYNSSGGNDRAFYYESYFLVFLCGPSWFMPTLLGWDNNRYDQATTLTWLAEVNSPTSTAYPEFITPFTGSPNFMFYYQLAEGIFHIMIVCGGLCALRDSTWPPRDSGASVRLFSCGLWLEIIIMDILYVIAFSCIALLSVPGHWGLTTYMMLLHHIGVLPDIMCAWHEQRAWKSRVSVYTPSTAA